MTRSSESQDDSPADRPNCPVPASRFFLFAVVAGAGCFADLISKRLVFQWRGMPGEKPIWWVWEGFAGIETSLNTGALFGLGENKVLLFALFSFVALLGIFYWFAFARGGHDLLLSITLACITGGILGNLYDRLGLWSPTVELNVAQTDDPQIQLPRGYVPATGRIHAVRDWIRLSYRTNEFIWPNFNIADSLLVCGAGLLLWQSFRAGQQNELSESRAERITSS